MAELEKRAKEFALDTDGDNFKCEGSDPLFAGLLGMSLPEGSNVAEAHGFRTTVWGGPDAIDMDAVPLGQDYERLLVCIDGGNVIYSVINS